MYQIPQTIPTNKCEAIDRLRGYQRIHPSTMEQFEARRPVRFQSNAGVVAAFILDAKDKVEAYELKPKAEREVLVEGATCRLKSDLSGNEIWSGKYEEGAFVNQKSPEGFYIEMLKKGGRQFLKVVRDGLEGIEGTLSPQPALVAVRR